MEIIIILLALLAIIVVTWRRYAPSIDITKTGYVVLWYNYHYFNRPNKKWFVARQSTILFKLTK